MTLGQENSIKKLLASNYFNSYQKYFSRNNKNLQAILIQVLKLRKYCFIDRINYQLFVSHVMKKYSVNYLSQDQFKHLKLFSVTHKDL